MLKMVDYSIADGTNAGLLCCIVTSQDVRLHFESNFDSICGE